MSLNDVDFTGQMQQGRDLAQIARNRGQSGRSRGKWAKAPPAADTPENRLYADLAELRRELQDRDNTIAVLRASGGAEPEPIDPWGAEFDRLSGKAQRPGLPPRPPLSPCGSTTAARPRGSCTMTTEQYLRALKKLGLTRASRETADALGVSVRHAQKYASGDAPIPETVAKLLRMYLDYGRPGDDE